MIVDILGWLAGMVLMVLLGMAREKFFPARAPHYPRAEGKDNVYMTVLFLAVIVGGWVIGFFLAGFNQLGGPPSLVGAFAALLLPCILGVLVHALVWRGVSRRRARTLRSASSPSVITESR